MPLTTVEELLARTMGLDPSSLGAGAIASAVRERMAQLGLDSEMEYALRAAASIEETGALIETVVVPETWFFRHPEAFVYLGRFVAAQRLRFHPDRPLRILSVPCSAGEEPYSIAMSLQEAGVRPEQFHIDAFDISRELLRKAEDGGYTARAFRGASEAQRGRFFDPTGGGYRVRPEIRTSIRFAWGNLIDPMFLLGEQPYDVIFCRNVLIYQHAEARKRTIAVLDRFLAEDGVLFVGHAEVIKLLCERFATVSHPGAFAFARGPKPNGRPSDASAFQPKPGTRAAKTATPRPAQPARAAAPSTPRPARATGNGEETLLERARLLADQGRIAEAGTLCERFIQEHSDSASAHFLLGVMHDTAGRVQQAEECMNRAIYLDAEHPDALMHLSLLLAQRGDNARADLLRRRAARVRQRREVSG